MQKTEASWRSNVDWKARYSKLYSSQRISVPAAVEPQRISFMSNDSTPYASLMRSRSGRRDSIGSESYQPQFINSIMSQRSDPYSSFSGIRSLQSDDLGGHETMLLDMVRARSKQWEEENQEHTLDLPKDSSSDDQSCEACVHGLSMRATERSMSRSRVSRISTRRDIDIPTILAFTTNTVAPAQHEIPAFQRSANLKQEKNPVWSIRRSVCPVCSQKWKDRSKISNVKYSGLKRNSSSELPSIIAPARLRVAITMAYSPRPALAVVDEDLPGYGAMRSTSATWQLTRARKFRTPKPQTPPPEATAPPSAAAPLARKDLDIRVLVEALSLKYKRKVLQIKACGARLGKNAKGKREQDRILDDIPEFVIKVSVSYSSENSILYADL